jgi:hypothetical protein
MAHETSPEGAWDIVKYLRQHARMFVATITLVIGETFVL